MRQSDFILFLCTESPSFPIQNDFFADELTNRLRGSMAMTVSQSFKFLFLFQVSLQDCAFNEVHF